MLAEMKNGVETHHRDHDDQWERSCVLYYSQMWTPPLLTRNEIAASIESSSVHWYEYRLVARGHCSNRAGEWMIWFWGVDKLWIEDVNGSHRLHRESTSLDLAVCTSTSRMSTRVIRQRGCSFLAKRIVIEQVTDHSADLLKGKIFAKADRYTLAFVFSKL